MFTKTKEFWSHELDWQIRMHRLNLNNPGASTVKKKAAKVGIERCVTIRNKVNKARTHKALLVALLETSHAVLVYDNARLHRDCEGILLDILAKNDFEDEARLYLSLTERFDY